MRDKNSATSTIVETNQKEMIQNKLNQRTAHLALYHEVSLTTTKLTLQNVFLRIIKIVKIQLIKKYISFDQVLTLSIMLWVSVGSKKLSEASC